MAITRIGLNQSINLASNVTGTLPTGNGGTGATSFVKGKVLKVAHGTTGTAVAVSSNTYTDAGFTTSITPVNTAVLPSSTPLIAPSLVAVNSAT